MVYRDSSRVDSKLQVHFCPIEGCAKHCSAANEDRIKGMWQTNAARVRNAEVFMSWSAKKNLHTHIERTHVA